MTQSNLYAKVISFGWGFYLYFVFDCDDNAWKKIKSISNKMVYLKIYCAFKNSLNLIGHGH